MWAFLRCLFGLHGATIRHTTPNGIRLFLCDDCGCDLGPVISREGRFIGAGPACESMKARPKTSRDAMKVVNR